MQLRLRGVKSTFLGVLPLLLALAVAACAPTVAQRGNVPDPDKLAELKPGDTKDKVVQTIGSPSTIGTFSDKKWYYISRKTEKVAFFDPKTVDQQVVEVVFDQDDKIQEIKTLNLNDAYDVDVVGRSTPTAGKSLTVMDQLLGNIGRFNKAGGGKAAGQ